MLKWEQENDLWFCYKDNQKLTSQWVQDEDNRWFYLEKDGRMVTKWFQTANDNDFWFYAYPNQIKDDNGDVIHLTGEMATGFQQVDGKWYYLCQNKVTNYGIEYVVGAMIKNWFEIENKWCYFIEVSNASKGEYQGQMVANCTRTINGKDYVFNNDGSLVEDSSEGLVSEECINFVKNYEQFFSYKYDDSTGVITQGYGCIGDEIADWGDTITEQQASDRLKELINNNYAKPIKSDLDSKGISLTQYQQDALYSCAYNIGVSSLLNSSLYRYIVGGGRDTDTIQSYFCMWNRGGGKVMEGLTKRRIAESNIFNNGIYDSTH